MRRVLKIVSINFLIFLALIALAEVSLRVFTYAPQGKFKLWFPGRLGLYPENAEQSNYSVVNWVVKTNSWGFRGDEFALEKSPGSTRIAMLGDSITDGFYVENEDTYPVRVQEFLRQDGVNAEVINAASGGATINRELAIFKDAVTPLKPDVAVLSFVTNDIHDLQGISDDQLLHARSDSGAVDRKILRFLFVYTAVGERVLYETLCFISKDFREAQRQAAESPERDPDRYNIPGGNQYAENSRQFMVRYSRTDSQILVDNISLETQKNIGRYLLAWDAFMAHAAKQGIQPVFVYVPAYPQVYDLSISMRMRDLLRDHSEQKGVPFLDLTPVMREEGADKILHLAPKDFHHNPEGNRVIGKALATFLVEQGLVKKP